MKLGRLPYHQLTVADFAIKPSPAGKDDYYVQTFMDPRYDGFLYFNRGWVHGYMKNFQVFSGLNQAASYRRKGFEKMDDYLPVAQAILDLNEIRARELGMMPPDGWPEYRGGAEAEVKAGLEARVKALCQAKFDQAQADIDQLLKATDQGRNKKKARKMAAEIRQRLEAMPKSSAPIPTIPAAAAGSPSPVAEGSPGKVLPGSKR